jgi:hypothetical protein
MLIMREKIQLVMGAVSQSEVTENSKIFLSQYLELLHQKKEERIIDHISSNPTLRAVPAYCPEVIDEIELNSSEEKVNEILF